MLWKNWFFTIIKKLLAKLIWNHNYDFKFTIIKKLKQSYLIELCFFLGEKKFILFSSQFDFPKLWPYFFCSWRSYPKRQHLLTSLLKLYTIKICHQNIYLRLHLRPPLDMLLIKIIVSFSFFIWYYKG